MGQIFGDLSSDRRTSPLSWEESNAETKSKDWHNIFGEPIWHLVTAACNVLICELKFDFDQNVSRTTLASNNNKNQIAYCIAGQLWIFSLLSLCSFARYAIVRSWRNGSSVVKSKFTAAAGINIRLEVSRYLHYNELNFINSHRLFLQPRLCKKTNERRKNIFFFAEMVKESCVHVNMEFKTWNLP